MCGPWAIPLALIAAGSGAKYIGETQATNARENTYNEEQQRQNALTAQQTAHFQDSVSSAKTLTDPAAIAAAASAREGTLVNAIAPTPTAGSYLPGSSSAPSIVAAAGDKASAATRGVSLNLAHSIAALGGAQDQQQGVDTAVGRNAGLIGQEGSFKAGSASVLDAEMRAAAQKGSFLRGAGGLAQQVGAAWLGGQVGGSIIGGGGANAYGIQGVGNIY